MKDYLLQLKSQVIGLWQRMTRNQKILLISSAALLFIVLIILAWGATRPDYGVLFTLKDEQSAQLAVEKIKEKNIPYKVDISDQGATILIPTKDIPDTRLLLAGENIPTGGVVGFESFESTKLGETETDRRVRHLRALQGELTRTIEHMAEVETARVHIVQPEPSLFLDEQQNATAAVMLKLKPNKTLNPEQVNGLVKLVSNSVEGLKPENVTIVDVAGNVLSDDLPTDEQSIKTHLTVTQVELQREYQREIQNSVQSMLERIVGPGKAVVRVQLSLDFDRIQIKKQDYGEQPVVRSEQILEEESSSNSSNAPMPPGTNANTVPGYEPAAQTGNSEMSKEEKITNYEIDMIEEIKDVAPGSVKRLSVAVVVDQELDNNQLQLIRNVVESAVGFDADRGDQISVAGMPFNTEYQDALSADLAKADYQQKMLFYGGLAAAALVFGAIIAVIMVRKRRTKETELPAEDEALVKPMPVEELEELVIPEKEMTPEEKEKIKIKERVEKVAQENPNDIAQLLRTWLADD